MPKICKKHKKPFYGLRCPLCTAPPAIKDPDEDVPFPEDVATEDETSDNNAKDPCTD